MRICTKGFRFSTKIYDVISIGPYANKVAKEVANICRLTPTILGVEEENFSVQPSALPYSEPRIKLNQNVQGIGDFEQGVGLKGILPNDNKVVLKNGNTYFYKNLIYSGSSLDWKDTRRYPGLDSFLEKDNTFIYGDKSYKDLDQILERILGTVVFVIPNGRHFGSENYLMMLLQAKMKRRVQNMYPGQKSGKIIILNEGSSLIQNNKAHNDILEQLLKDQGILHLKNQKLKFDYVNKKVHLNKKKQYIKFDALFHYLPIKIPSALPFDPFKSNTKTLNHSLYENISILGNVYPTTFSLSAIQKMGKVMARNIAYKIMGVRKQCLYKGETETKLWINEVEAMTISTNYNTEQIQSISGNSKLSRLALGRLYKYGQKPIIDKIINGGVDFSSLTQKYEEINTNRHQLPTIYHKSF